MAAERCSNRCDSGSQRWRDTVSIDPGERTCSRSLLPITPGTNMTGWQAPRALQAGPGADIASVRDVRTNDEIAPHCPYSTGTETKYISEFPRHARLAPNGREACAAPVAFRFPRAVGARPGFWELSAGAPQIQLRRLQKIPRAPSDIDVHNGDIRCRAASLWDLRRIRNTYSSS